jgi:SLAP domain-containing protein
MVVFSCVLTSQEKVSAATGSTELLHKTSTARANSLIRYNFTISKDTDISIKLSENIRTTASISLKTADTESSVQTDTLSSADSRWVYNKSTGIYQYTHTMNLPKGDYIFELNFDTEVNYELYVNTVSSAPTLAKSKISITKGFTDTIKVKNGKIKSCTSSNKSVATVTNSGKVTAKKVGTAKITVKLKTGKKLTCKVTVKKNTYSASKLTIADMSYNTVGMKAYAASFDSKGNLVVKFVIGNNNVGEITSIPNFKITVKDSSKKTVATYKKSSYSATVTSYNAKSFSVTIPKSNLKKSASKIDIRTCKFTITGDNTTATN